MTARPRATLFVTVLALLGATVGTVTPTRAADPDPTVRYWTEERIRGATPREAVLPEGTEMQPAGATLADVSGDPWTGAGEILDRSGLVLFTLGGFDYSCSGAIVQDAADPSYSLVMTAAHCAYDQVDDVWATNWLFIPAWDLTPNASNCPETTHGCWSARALVIHRRWAQEEALTVAAVQHDYAVAVVGPGGKTSTQLDALGAYPVRIGGVADGDQLYAFGYPAGLPYDGSELVYCEGSVGTEPLSGSLALLCDMTSGASGGPWLYGSVDPADGSGELASVSSFRIQGDGGLYGVRLGERARDVHDVAKLIAPDAAGIDHLIVVEGATPFTDISSSTFREDIEWLYLAGITTGCTPTTYCPTANVSRGQMAAFLVRALDLPPTTANYFDDDNGTTFENDINALRAAQITTGCAVGKFCPTANVTRGQMAAFLVRALDLPSTTTDYFTDDDGTFEANINALAEAGITTGCGPTTYCPTANVTRGQMAAFLRRALE